MLQPQRLKVESAVSALRSRGVPQGKLCNMVKNVKISLLKVYEIEYFWSIWLLGAFESFCNLSAGRPGVATSEVESAVSALRLRGFR